LGTREEAAILLLRHYHIASSIALTSAFLMFFMNTALPGLIGAAVAPLFRKEAAKPEGVPDYATMRAGTGR
ncbi:MAG TPA: hypothetical protein VHB98_18910, partial [Chloroflexota bacterium]|nr:hypothetical protein [Chloroflexota bacterium]